jgi:Protein of unknown function (DUF2996)
MAAEETQDNQAKPETAAKAPKAAASEGAAPKAKEKPPKKEAVEDKPFPDFIQQDYLPALNKALSAQGVLDLKLSFQENTVLGQWMSGQRHFAVYFPEGDINAQRAFSCTVGNRPPSDIEPFLIDERKVNLDLLVFGVVQRLNAQKWFGNN